MPVVGDFIPIVGNTEQSIPQTSGNAEVHLPDFKTDGRESGDAAFLMCAAKDLKGSAQVFINDNYVGTITATSLDSMYCTQMIVMTGNQLNNGNNEIVLKQVTDPFEIKDVICFYHQSA
jgi:hypothetical protein